MELNVLASFLTDFFRESLALFNSLAPYLLLGFLVAGILHVLLPGDTVVKHLGGRGMMPVIKAALFGVPLPLCSCGVIPVAASLRKEGASRASVLSFLVSTPTTGVDSILATYSLMGPLFAVFRPIAALLMGISLGGITLLTAGHEAEAPAPKRPNGQISVARGIKEIAEYAFIELPGDIGKWVIVGVLAGGFLSAVIPQNIFARYLGNPLISFPLMIVVAVPLYVCATGSIPIAAALIAKGLNPGAALAFLIAGPATNTVTITVVGKMLGKKSLVTYLVSIILMALGAGLVFDLLYRFLGGDPSLITGAGRNLPLWLQISSSALLAIILFKALLKKPEREEVD
ncbi:MAG: permease, partial [Candidatus Hydrothermae bacterium]|nr:permease [Candidatus Hydrothermae bacterium]